MSRSRKPTVLVVDDDDAISDSLSLLLEMEGYQPVVSEVENFFEVIKKESPDVILLDVYLSGKDGRELCKKLKENAETAHVPVILVSASRHLAESAQSAKADAFVEKPFEMTTILETIEKVMRSPRHVVNS